LVRSGVDDVEIVQLLVDSETLYDGLGSGRARFGGLEGASAGGWGLERPLKEDDISNLLALRIPTNPIT
jgi:hypothetical protein